MIEKFISIQTFEIIVDKHLDFFNSCFDTHQYVTLKACICIAFFLFSFLITKFLYEFLLYFLKQLTWDQVIDNWGINGLTQFFAKPHFVVPI